MRRAFLLLSVVGLMFFLLNCKDDNDTTKPEVTVTAPTADAVYAIGESINLTAEFSDNKELKSCKASITYTGDGSGDGNPWAPSATSISLSGTSQSVDQVLFGGEITDCKLGDYTIKLEVSDAAGNVATKEIDIKIVSNAPELDVQKPQENDSFVAGQDMMTLTATCTDNNGLKELVYDVEYIDGGKNVLKGATGVNDPWEPGQHTITLSGTSKIFTDELLFDGQIPESQAGNYKLILKLYDNDNNFTTKEINFVLTN